MPETMEAKLKDTEAGQPNGGAPAQVPASVADTPQIRGLFNQQSNTGYWPWAMAALGAHYIFEAVFNLFKLPAGQHSEGLIAKRMTTLKALYAATFGLFMVGVTDFYRRRTGQDMRNLFAEPVGWELGKRPEDVTVDDIKKSTNSFVKDARDNSIRYNTRRFAINSTFFSFLLPFGKTFKEHWTPEIALGVGMGGNALYLMHDVLNRKVTPFERLQGFSNSKLNHNDRIGEHVTALDLMNIYDLHSRNNDTSYVTPAMNSAQWQSNEALFERMADLMNQTYHNVPVREQANFTVSKFIYMLGKGLVKPGESPEKNLAFVEVANRCDVKTVEQVAQAMSNGASLETALAPYPIPSLAELSENGKTNDNAQGIGGFGAKVMAENRSTGRAVSPPPAAQVDKIAQGNEAAAGAALG